MLRDGPALAIPDRDGETGPVTRLAGRPENSTANPMGLVTLGFHEDAPWSWPRFPWVGTTASGKES